MSNMKEFNSWLEDTLKEMDEIEYNIFSIEEEYKGEENGKKDML